MSEIKIGGLDQYGPQRFYRPIREQASSSYAVKIRWLEIGNKTPIPPHIFECFGGFLITAHSKYKYFACSGQI